MDKVKLTRTQKLIAKAEAFRPGGARKTLELQLVDALKFEQKRAAAKALTDLADEIEEYEDYPDVETLRYRASQYLSGKYEL